jgi:DNA polymerase-3 subunit alpha
VELQWRDADDVPRLTLRSLQPLAELARRTRGRLVVKLAHPGEVAAMQDVLGRHTAPGRGELVAQVATDAGTARLVLGRQWLIDADLEAALTRVLGSDRVEQEALEPPHLALVG